MDWCNTLQCMGRILLYDFKSQKKNLTGMFLIAIPAAIIGFAFQSMYVCIALILTAIIVIIYINTFFEYENSKKNMKKIKYRDDDGNRIVLKDNDADRNNDALQTVMMKKNEVRAKYVEILILVFAMYAVMYIAFTLDAFDNGSFRDPTYSIVENLEQISLYPMVMMFITSITTPLLFKIKISKAVFIGLAVSTIILLYGIFLLNLFFKFVEMEHLMVILPYPIIAICFISYFISMKLVIRKR